MNRKRTEPHLAFLQRARELADLRKRLRHVRSVNVHEDYQRTMSRGERAADGFARTVGSWRFIAVQSCVLAAWVVLNVVGWIHHWDPYPFILLNLALSFQAAYAAPIIMMSQNRAAELDRHEARRDAEVNKLAETEVEELLSLLQAGVAMLEDLRTDVRAVLEGRTAEEANPA